MTGSPRGSYVVTAGTQRKCGLTNPAAPPRRAATLSPRCRAEARSARRCAPLGSARFGFLPLLGPLLYVSKSSLLSSSWRPTFPIPQSARAWSPNRANGFLSVVNFCFTHAGGETSRLLDSTQSVSSKEGIKHFRGEKLPLEKLGGFSDH